MQAAPPCAQPFAADACVPETPRHSRPLGFQVKGEGKIGKGEEGGGVRRAFGGVSRVENKFWGRVGR